MSLKSKLFVLSSGVVLASVLFLARTSASNQGQGQYQAGGAWIINDGAGFVASCVQTPFDPTGKTGAIHASALNWAAGWADTIYALFGADSASNGTGEIRMTGRDTADWTFIAYDQVAGKAIVGIEVYIGTWQFTGPNTGTLKYTLNVYPASADTNRDGYPEPGAKPVLTVPGLTSTAHRVTVLQQLDSRPRPQPPFKPQEPI